MAARTSWLTPSPTNRPTRPSFASRKGDSTGRRCPRRHIWRSGSGGWKPPRKGIGRSGNASVAPPDITARRRTWHQMRQHAPLLLLRPAPSAADTD
jgi:hypothetical protein